jgi:hypothetical protein
MRAYAETSGNTPAEHVWNATGWLSSFAPTFRGQTNLKRPVVTGPRSIPVSDQFPW